MSDYCNCGATDCPHCHPGALNRCSRHGTYPGELEECPKCMQEIELWALQLEDD